MSLGPVVIDCPHSKSPCRYNQCNCRHIKPCCFHKVFYSVFLELISYNFSTGSVQDEVSSCLKQSVWLNIFSVSDQRHASPSSLCTAPLRYPLLFRPRVTGEEEEKESMELRVEQRLLLFCYCSLVFVLLFCITHDQLIKLLTIMFTHPSM